MNLMKVSLLRFWRLTRTASMVVGLAVMLALIAGVASLAVARTPSGGATATAILKGVSNTETTVTTLINTGTGAALNLRVLPGSPPLTVNSDAGTATNLSADKLDGKDSTSFVSAVDGKAPDSDKLDGKDSTAFLGATAKAADSDLLDGRDSTEFLGTTAKAADSEKLDGKDSADFAPAGTGAAYTARTEQTSMHNDPFDVVSKNVPAGSYAINAKAALRNVDDDDDATVICSLYAGDLVVDKSFFIVLTERTLEITPTETRNFALQAVVPNFGGGAIKVSCSEVGDSDEVAVFDTVITAIKVGSVQ